MKIALISEYYPPFAPGGAEWSAHALAKGLVAQGHRVVVVTPNYGTAPDGIEDGIRIMRFWFPLRLAAPQQTVSAKYLANPCFYLYAAWQIYRITRRTGVDLLYLHHKHVLIPGILTKFLLRCPAFVAIRDTGLFCMAPICLHRLESVPRDCSLSKAWVECAEEYHHLYIKGRSSLRTKLAFAYFWIDSQLKQWFLRWADGVVSVSRGLLRVYQRSGLLTAQQARVIYTLPPVGVSGGDPQVGERLRRQLGLVGKKVVLYVGKCSPGKGTADLLEAARLVCGRRDDVMFLLAGKGDLPESTAHVRVLGSLPHEEVLHLYHLANVVAVPSVTQESFSRVVLEAMAAGKPVVGTAVGGMAEAVLDGVNGFVVERRNPQQLAAAIDKILCNEDLERLMGEKGRELLAERFSGQEQINRLLRFFRGEEDDPGVAPRLGRGAGGPEAKRST